jgi:hypothetical protein
MEALLGADFSAVRVHLDSAEARDLGAHAFARGDTLHFSPGAWSPTTPAGWSVIAHELAHVVQQRSGRVRPAASGDVVRDDALEREAEAIGEAAAAMRLTRAHPVRPWFHDIPATHAGAVAVQCLMKVDVFKNESKADGLRNAIKSVDRELAEFHRLDGATPRDYVKLLAQIRKLYQACQTYAQRRPDSKRLPAVEKLNRQIALEESVLVHLADFQREVDVIKQWEALEKAQETVLASERRPDFARAFAGTELTDLIGKFENNATSTGDEAKLVQHEISSLKALAERSTLPRVLRDVILECTAVANVRQLDMKCWMPGAAYNTANGSTQKYTLKHWLEQYAGKKFRMASLLHELTHVSIAETFDNTVIMLAISRWATDAEILQLARDRAMKIGSLQSLIASSASIDAGQRKELKDKSDYPISPKLNTYLSNFKPKLGLMYGRLQPLVAQGLRCELIEYDTVINQMALWCHLWGLPENDAVYAELLTQAKDAFDYRAAARRLRRPVPLLDLSRVQRDDGTRVARVPMLNLAGLGR